LEICCCIYFGLFDLVDVVWAVKVVCAGARALHYSAPGGGVFALDFHAPHLARPPEENHRARAKNGSRALHSILARRVFQRLLELL
jgi:hypothetical protein